MGNGSRVVDVEHPAQRAQTIRGQLARNVLFANTTKCAPQVRAAEVYCVLSIERMGAERGAALHLRLSRNYKARARNRSANIHQLECSICGSVEGQRKG